MFIINAIKKWWREFNMSADELYLSQSVNIVDLENRIREVIAPSQNNHRRYR